MGLSCCIEAGTVVHTHLTARSHIPHCVSVNGRLCLCDTLLNGFTHLPVCVSGKAVTGCSNFCRMPLMHCSAGCVCLCLCQVCTLQALAHRHHPACPHYGKYKLSHSYPLGSSQRLTNSSGSKKENA